MNLDPQWDSALVSVTPAPTASGQVPEWNGSLWVPSTIASVALTPGPEVGQSMGPSGAQGNANQAMTLDQLYLCPFVIPTSATCKEIAVNVGTAGAAGSVVRLGLYSSDVDGQPDALLLDAGTINSTVTGNIGVAISQAIGPGIVWAACVAQTAAPSIRFSGPSGSSLYSITPTSGLSNLTSPSVNLLGPSGVSGGLPNPIGALSATAFGSNAIPLLILGF